MPPLQTRREQLLGAFKARLQEITEANGFWTEAGLTVFMGEAPDLGPNDPDQAIAIVVGDEEQNWQLPGKGIGIRLPLAVQAVAKVGTDEDAAWQTVERLIGDIQRAIETTDPLVDGWSDWPLEIGPVRTLKRETGSTNVGSELTYRAVYKRGWGSP
jgi:hypothetical protein